MTKFSLCLATGIAITGTMCFSSGARCADDSKKVKPPAPADIMSQLTEEELAHWKPDHEDLGPVIGKMLQPKADIAGEWATDGMLDESSLSIRKKESGKYSISLSTDGCLGGWQLQREGTFARSVIRLNKPVEEYVPFTYDTLYVISVNGTEYLISQDAIRFIVKNYSKNGQVDWSQHLKFAAFHRKDKESNKVAK